LPLRNDSASFRQSNKAFRALSPESKVGG
jgi:hypothetical protein